MIRYVFSFLILIQVSFQAKGSDLNPSALNRAATSILQLSEDVKINAIDQFGVGGDKSLFGQSMDASGNTAVVGAPGAMGHGLAFVYQFNGSEWQLTDTLAPADGLQGDEFGYAVSLHQNRIVIGAREASVGRDQPGKAYIFSFDVSSQEWQQEQVLLASDHDDNDEFGASIAQNNDTLFIGAPNYNQFGLRGQVYVYKLVGGHWVESERISGSGQFGNAIAISGSQVFIGSKESGIAGLNRSGAVFLYEFDGNDWVQVQTIIASDPEESHYFGSSINLSNDVLLIGADKDGRFEGVGPGAVYVFGLNDQVWIENQKLEVPGDTHLNRFGSYIASSNDQIIVSSISDENVNPYEGAVHIFEFNGAQWTHAHALNPLTGSTDDELGFSVALSGDELLVGAYGYDVQDNEAGAIHTFSFTGASWTTGAIHDMPPGSALNYFGKGIGLDGQHMMIGSWGDDAVTEQSGSVYAYLLTEGEWVFSEKILPSGQLSFQSFGYAIDINGNRAIIGAPGFDTDIDDPGAAYIYEYNGTNWELVTQITASDGMDDDYFGGSVSIFGDHVLVGGTGADTFGDRSGAAYVFKYENDNWSEVKRLVFPAAQEDDYIGMDLAINDDWAVVGQSGAVHFFQADSNWDHSQTISGQGRLGRSVDLDGEVVAVGAYINTNVSGGRGSVNVYTLNSLVWEFDQQIYPQQSGFDFFGIDVALSGNEMIVGSSWAAISGSFYSGAAYWFIYDNGEWRESRAIVSANASKWDSFGGHVNIDDSQVVIGELGLDDYGTNSGAAYAFEVSDVIFETGFDINPIN